jgi:NADH-quinone oxidoreductase subunit M
MLSLLLILIPTLAAIGIAWGNIASAKQLALGISLAVLGLVLYMYLGFKPAGGSQYEYTKSWISGLNINFALGADGITMVLLLLTALLIPVIILSNFYRNEARNPLFFGLILFMQAALMGVFLAKDVFLFYFFFEVTLLPIYFLCAIWGGENRIAVTFKFFVYTLFGSLFMLLALVYLYYQTPGSHSAYITDLYKLTLDAKQQGLVFAAILLAFAIKMPLFPFHSWQPDTYVTAPAAGSMLLAGIMLKMGTYGLIRLLLPIVPYAVSDWGYIPISLAVIGIVYGSIIAIMQQDIKRLIAYSSFAHVGLMAAGILTKSASGIQGAIIQMLAHGINVVGLFIIADIVFRRTDTQQLNALGGLTQKARNLTICFIIIMLGAVALPLTNGFVGEFLLLKSLFDYKPIVAAIAGLGIILGAVYMLRLIQKTLFGPIQDTHTVQFTDLNWYEKAALYPLVALVLLLGVAPNLILKISEPAVNQLLTLINR